MNKNTKLLLVINTIRKIIEIFLGPFLTAYLFKVAVDNIQIISTYNIFSYIVIAIVSLMIGRILKKKHEMQVFRFGIISEFLQLLILIIFGENIVNHIWILGVISGISVETWSFPLNLFSSTLVSNDEKNSYIVYRTMFTNLSKGLVPFLLGTIISIKSFEITAIIILMLSILQIILSFELKYEKPDKQVNIKLNIIEECKKIKENKQLKRFYKIKFLKGIAYEGALTTAVTLLVIMTFNSDFSLGIITSITYLLAITSSYIYKNIKNIKKIKLLLIISCTIMFITSIFLVFVTNRYTIIAYNIIFAFFLQFVRITEEVQTLKFTNSKVIDDSNRIETYILLEFFLNAGRIISYALLFISGIYNSIYLIEVIIALLVLSIVFETISLIKFNEEQELEEHI